MINLVKGAPKPATDKLLELYALIRDQYSGILSKEDLSTMNYILFSRIEDVLKEEKEFALNNGL